MNLITGAATIPRITTIGLTIDLMIQCQQEIPLLHQTMPLTMPPETTRNRARNNVPANNVVDTDTSETQSSNGE
jgi:hypothetical protein